VRILLDYRPALSHRTGVGEYVHELATALLARGDTPDVLTLFSSSWRDRIDRAAVPGAVLADQRVPVRLLNYAWHRWQWPPVELVSTSIFPNDTSLSAIVAVMPPVFQP